MLGCWVEGSLQLNKEVMGAEGPRSPPTWLPCLITLCSLLPYSDHDEDLGHLSVDRPPGLQ